jgi:sulfide dehydrogenase [flavocytochrome c] flavoprotein subunit
MTSRVRRNFLRLAGGALALPLAAPLLRAAELLPKEAQRVVIVGGGFAGAIAAKTLRMANAEVEVVLIERNPSYSALPGANWAIGGSRRIGENRLSYDRLESRYGVRIVYGEALALEAGERKVVLAAGTLAYDHAIVAPGIGLRTEEIEGNGAEAQQARPHAWTSGEEVAALRRHQEEMKNGGVVLVSLPLPPFR